ncbi:MAG: hypothetical protein IH621_14885 [Krumholzibacteria bacterium]|nr:hypothetical protein [Candidatus Krumholzibacteria bacterium]
MLAALVCTILAGCSDEPATPADEPEVVTRTVRSDEYIPNRFFKLDLPELEAHGRDPATERIDLGSLKIFALEADRPFGPNDIRNVAAYFDSTGCRDWNASTIDFTRPHVTGLRWRQWLDLDLMVEDDGTLAAVDLGSSAPWEATLAVVYRVLDPHGQVLAQVGDDPTLGPPEQTVEGKGDELHYRMKLLKLPAVEADPWLHRYALRNIYSLGSSNIAPTTFEFSIEASENRPNPQLDELWVEYFAIFGLDRQDLAGNPGADGVADIHDPALFDLQRGLLRFPADMPEPFAATRARYEANVQDPDWYWSWSTYLTENLEPALYSPGTPPAEFPHYGRFRLVVRTLAAPGD